MAECPADHVDDWQVGDRFDLLREMRLLTLRTLGDTLLVVDTTGDEELVLVLATMVGRVDLGVPVAEPLTFSPSLSLCPEMEVDATVRDC
jgi:hypothetical protein